MKKQPPNQGFGAHLRQLREQKSWTLEKAAQETGVSLGYLSLLERGKREASLKILEKLADKYEADLDELVKIASESRQTSSLPSISEKQLLDRLDAAWALLKTEHFFRDIALIEAAELPTLAKLALVDYYQDLVGRLLLTNREMSMIKSMQIEAELGTQHSNKIK